MQTISSAEKGEETTGRKEWQAKNWRRRFKRTLTTPSAKRVPYCHRRTRRKTETLRQKCPDVVHGKNYLSIYYKLENNASKYYI